MFNVAEIFINLNGEWQIDRKISNQGNMHGTACFKHIANETNTLHYREQGVLKINSDRSFNIHREYIYHLRNNNISVCFAENNNSDQLFHTLEFDNFPANNSAIIAKGKYLCGCDKYTVIYEFYTDNQFNITYRVKGPSKDYVSITSFRRNK